MKSIRNIILAAILIFSICSCGNSVQEETGNIPVKTKPTVPLQTVEDLPRTQVQAKIFIDSLYKRVQNGEDFATLANKYSEDPGSNKSGGEYDGVKIGIFVPEFEKVVFNLKLNEFSTPFLTEYGYHIAKVIAIRKGERDVRHILIRFEN
jgi:parvulin-like peptidyl-prolyl isomerase